MKLRLLRWLQGIRSPSATSATEAGAARNGISFEGGTGGTVEAAIVVRGARTDVEGTCTEFTWLTHTYGQIGQEWQLAAHYHGKYGGKDIDTFSIVLADGKHVCVFFDCSESFGRQGQRQLTPHSRKHFEHEVVVPAARATFHDNTVFARMLL